MRKRIAILLAGTLILGVFAAGCGKQSEATRESEESEKTEKEGKGDDSEETGAEETVTLRVVGISMPSKEQDPRWSQDAEEMHLHLEQDGYNSRITYAEEDPEKQEEQIRTMIESEVAAIIVNPVDPFGLTEVLQEAEDAGIPVFSYDTLIMNSDAVTYYLTYNTRRVGQLTAQKVIDTLGLSIEEPAAEKETTPTVTPEAEAQESSAETYQIEFLMGEPNRLSDLYFYNGVMEVLQPYFDQGILETLSGRSTFDDTSVMGRSTIISAKRLQKILQDYYQEEDLDILVTADDEIALAAADMLERMGKIPSLGNAPLITGFGCSAECVRSISQGEILCSTFMNNRALADKCIETVNTYLSGEKPEVDDYEQYDNGVKIIRTIVCDPQMIDASNYQMLVDDGYYTEEDLAITPAATATPVPTQTETTKELP